MCSLIFTDFQHSAVREINVIQKLNEAFIFLLQ